MEERGIVLLAVLDPVFDCCGPGMCPRHGNLSGYAVKDK